jgi:hypothetical protein
MLQFGVHLPSRLGFITLISLVNVKLSLLLIKHRAMEAWRSGGISPQILGEGYRSVLRSGLSDPTLGAHLNRRLRGPRCQSGRCREGKNNSRFRQKLNSDSSPANL